MPVLAAAPELAAVPLRQVSLAKAVVPSACRNRQQRKQKITVANAADEKSAADLRESSRMDGAGGDDKFIQAVARRAQRAQPKKT